MILIEKNEIFLLGEIVKKNFSSKYKESYIGIFWTILNPLLMMTLFTVVFSTLFKRNIENFPLYFLCGWCSYMFFNSAINMSMNSLKNNKNILRKTPAPKHIFVLGAIISEFLNFLIMMVLLVGVMIVTHATFHWSILPLVIIPIGALMLMLIGVGLILSIACVYYTDIRHLWSVLSMMFLYSSGIFYPMSIIPEQFRRYMILNPLFWAIDQLRDFVYYGCVPQVIYMVNFILLSLIILILGIIFFKKFESKITMRL